MSPIAVELRVRKRVTPYGVCPAMSDRRHLASKRLSFEEQ